MGLIISTFSINSSEFQFLTVSIGSFNSHTQKHFGILSLFKQCVKGSWAPKVSEALHKKCQLFVSPAGIESVPGLSADTFRIKIDQEALETFRISEI